MVLTVALYPVYDWMLRHMGGRRRLAALLLTLISLLIVIGPATWLVLGLIDSIGTLSARLDFSTLVLPPPPEAIKAWPLVGEPIYQFWDLASTNLREALARVAPHLDRSEARCCRSPPRQARERSVLIAIVVRVSVCAGARTGRDHAKLLRKLAAGRGERIRRACRATIRTVPRGVIGISALQAFFAGIGFMVAGIPGASLLTSAADLSASSRSARRSSSR
jgi:predicted PurR-regulated permease PerM